jgi:hypothetical protein
LPFATASAGWVVNGPGAFTDSVDADDGVIDGSGTGGRSFYSGNTQSQLTITFAGFGQQGLPTHAGLVWTDVGVVSPGLPTGLDNITFEAFDPGGVLLESLGPTGVGDGLVTGGTSEDNCYGVISLSGIESIRITSSSSVDWEVDHIQYGVVPTPPSLALASVASLIFARRRRCVRKTESRIPAKYTSRE